MGRQAADYLFAILVALWVGGLWAIGGISAPTLFSAINNTSVAGTIAGMQFAAMAWVGIGSACYMLIYLFAVEGAKAFRTAVLWLVVVMLLLTLAGHFGIGAIIAGLRLEAMPREVMESAVRDRFQAWHGIASVVYVVECVLGAGLVTQVFKRH